MIQRERKMIIKVEGRRRFRYLINFGGITIRILS
jgi:hypothetical protein